MTSADASTDTSPRAVPWPWRVLLAVIVAAAAAALLQVIPLPDAGTAAVVAALVILGGALDVWVRSHYIGHGIQRSYLQLIGMSALLLIIGTLLLLGRPAPQTGGLVVSALIGVVIFLVLHAGHGLQARRAQLAAAPHDAASSSLTAIAARGGDHHPSRDDLRPRPGLSG